MTHESAMAPEDGKIVVAIGCTANAPNRQLKWHPDAKSVGDQRDGWPSGDLQDYKCPNCGKEFTVELPQ